MQLRGRYMSKKASKDTFNPKKIKSVDIEKMDEVYIVSVQDDNYNSKRMAAFNVSDACDIVKKYLK